MTLSGLTHVSHRNAWTCLFRVCALILDQNVLYDVTRLARRYLSAVRPLDLRRVHSIHAIYESPAATPSLMTRLVRLEATEMMQNSRLNVICCTVGWYILSFDVSASHCYRLWSLMTCWYPQFASNSKKETDCIGEDSGETSLCSLQTSQTTEKLHLAGPHTPRRVLPKSQLLPCKLSQICSRRHIYIQFFCVQLPCD